MKVIALSSKTQATVVHVDKPVPAKDELLVKVKYSALDTALDPVAENEFMSSYLHKKVDPLICGWHFCGVVEQVGGGVSKNEFAVKQIVFGYLPYDPETIQGTLSEYVTVKASQCAEKPESIDDALAAASATEVSTALQGVRDDGGISSEQSKKNSGNQQEAILINGGGGQVGGSAVQIAKRLGAHVTAVCSTKDVERVKRLGADVVIDRKKTDVLSSLKPRSFNVIFDTAGNLSSAGMLKFLRPKGRFVFATAPGFGFLWGLFRAMFVGKSVAFLMCHPEKADMELIGQWLQDGFEVDIDSTYPVKDITTAMARNRDSSKKGRVVIQVEGGW